VALYMTSFRETYFICSVYQYIRGHAVAYRLRHCATSRKVAGSRLDEMNEFLSIYLIVPAALSPGDYSASNRNEYQKQKNNVFEGRMRPVCRADNLTTTYRPPRPVTGLALLYGDGVCFL
jgi:hypothetical protein